VTVDRLEAEPRHSVIAILPGGENASAAVADLVAAGFPRRGIGALCGDNGLERLDPTGRYHGLWGRIVRTTQVVFAWADEVAHDAEHIGRGGVGLSVPAATPDEARRAAEILRRHGAQHIRYFGSLTFTELS
jgi:hypothetical protein